MIGEKIDEFSFWALGTAIFFLPLAVTTNTGEVFGAPKIALLRSAAAVLLAAAAWRLFSANQLRLPVGPLALTALVFILIVAAATILSIDPTISFIGLRKRFFGLSTYLALLVMFLSAASLTWSYQRLRTFSWLVVTGATGSALVGLTQQLGATWPADFKAVFGDHVYSTFGNPNFLGAYLVMALGPALALVFTTPEAAMKAVPAAALAAIILGLALTRSSGAAAGAIVVTLVYFYLARPGGLRGPRTRLIAAATAVLLTVLAVGLLFQIDATALKGRLAAWHGTVALISANAWHGVGPDTVRFAIPNKLPPAKNFIKEIPEDGHNVLLTTAAVAGLPALAVFVLLFSLSVSATAKAAADAGGRAGTLLHGVVAATVGYVAAGMVNPDNIVSLTLFWVCLGISQSRRWARVDHTLPTTLSYPAAIIAVVTALAAGVYTGYAISAEVHLGRAEDSRYIAPMLFEYNQAERRNPYYDWYSIRITDRLMPLVGPARPRETELAIAAADRAIRKAPLESDNYVIKGTVHRTLAKVGSDKRHLAKAVALYKKALGLNRLNLNAMRDLIECYVLLGDTRQARLYIDRYLSLVDDPDIKTIRRNLK